MPFLLLGGALALLGGLALLGALHATGFLRSVPLLLLLAGISGLAFAIVRVNVDPAWSVAAGIAAPAAVLAWAAWRPGSSRRKLWVMRRSQDAMQGAAWVGLIAFALALPFERFRLDAWLAAWWPLPVAAAAAWGLGRLVQEVVVRSVAGSPENMRRLREM